MNTNDCYRLATAALKDQGLYEQGWRFEFDTAKRRGGQCRYADKRITMSRHLVELWDEAEVRDTILHEVAHALAGPGAGHGPQWVAQARAIGCSGTRTHSNVTIPGAYVAVCPTHGDLPGRRHRRVIGATHKNCGLVVRWSHRPVV